MDLEKQNETIELPLGNANLEQNTTTFREVVEKSKRDLEKTIKLPTEKGKPGRKKLPRDANGNIIRAGQSENGPGSPSVDPQASAEITEYLATTIESISKIPAEKTGVPEIAFDKDESLACAKSINSALNVFFPDLTKLSPKSAALISLASTVGTITFTKYQIYLLKKATLEPTSTEVSPESNPAPPVGPTIDAANYFQRENH